MINIRLEIVRWVSQIIQVRELLFASYFINLFAVG